MSWSSTSLFGISKLAHHCPGPPSKEDPVLVPGATVVIMEHSDLSIANSWPLIVRGMSMLSWIPSAASARGLGRYHTPDRKVLAYWWSYPQGKTGMGARGVEWVHSCVKCNLCLLLTNLCHSKENLPTFKLFPSKIRSLVKPDHEDEANSHILRVKAKSLLCQTLGSGGLG